jgi:hypothetical protein
MTLWTSHPALPINVRGTSFVPIPHIGALIPFL